MFRMYLTVFLSLIFGLSFLHHTNGTKCPSPGGIYSYSHCLDPIHGDYLKTQNKTCIAENTDVAMDMIYRVERSTADQIIYVKKLVKHFERIYIRCPKSVGRLHAANLTDKIVICRQRVNTKNPVTKTYLELSTLVHVIRQLHCQFSKHARECCVYFPKKLYYFLNKRVLSKWFNFQSKLGDVIDNHDCEVSVPLINVSFTFCEETRDVIYLLLRHVEHTLENSLEVLRPEVLCNV